MGVLVSDWLAGGSDLSGIVSAPRFGTAGVSFGGRGGQFQPDSCRPGPETDHSLRQKLTMTMF